MSQNLRVPPPPALPAPLLPDTLQAASAGAAIAAPANPRNPRRVTPPGVALFIGMRSSRDRGVYCRSIALVDQRSGGRLDRKVVPEGGGRRHDVRVEAAQVGQSVGRSSRVLVQPPEACAMAGLVLRRCQYGAFR